MCQGTAGVVCCKEEAIKDSDEGSWSINRHFANKAELSAIELLSFAEGERKQTI